MADANSDSVSSLEESMNNLNLSNGEDKDANRKHAKDFTFGRVLGEGAYGAVSNLPFYTLKMRGCAWKR